MSSMQAKRLGRDPAFPVVIASPAKRGVAIQAERSEVTAWIATPPAGGSR